MVDKSSGRLRFDLEDLYATAPAFRRAGGELEHALQQAKRRLEGLGDFWGNDKLGQKFGSIYKPGQERLLELLSIVSGEVDGIADGITRMADEYGVAEQGNVSRIQSLREGK